MKVLCFGNAVVKFEYSVQRIVKKHQVNRAVYLHSSHLVVLQHICIITVSELHGDVDVGFEAADRQVPACRGADWCLSWFVRHRAQCSNAIENSSVHKGVKLHAAYL